MNIRPARTEDALSMARVFVDTFLAAMRPSMTEEAFQARKREWTYEVFEEIYQKKLAEIEAGAAAQTCIYVAEDAGGEVMGFALGCPSKDENDPPEVGELDLLYVSEKYQRQGIGRALAQATAARLADLGMTRLHILTPIDHTQGRTFYNKLGGVVVGTRDDYDEGELIVLVIYEWPDMRTFAEMGS